MANAQAKKSERTKEVERSFGARDNDGKYACQIGNCNQQISCQEANGTPGRLAHMLRHHRDEYDKLPAARKYKAIAAAQGEAATPPKRDAKRQRDDLHEDELLDFISAEGLPYRIVESKLLKKLFGKSRNSIPELLKKRAELFIDQLKRATVAKRIALTIDSGTTIGIKTLNATVVVDGVARATDAAHLDSHNADTIKTYIVEFRQQFESSYFVGLTTDNASAMVKAALLATSEVGGLYATCGCHTINLLYKNIFSEWKETVEALETLEKARSFCATAEGAVLPKLPRRIDTRWLPDFEGLRVLCENWEKFIARQAIPRQSLAGIQKLFAELEPLYLTSRKLERDTSSQCNLFELLVQVLTPEIVDQPSSTTAFRHWMARNVWSEPLVLASVLHPSTPVKLITPAGAIMFRIVCAQAIQKLRLNRVQFEGTIEQQQAREVRIWLSGAIQEKYNVSVQKWTVNGMWEAIAVELPLLSELWSCLLHLPASSASCERSFSLLDHLLDPSRTRVEVKGVAAQMCIASFLQKDQQVSKPSEVEKLDPLRAKAFFDELLRAWCAIRASEVEKGNDLCVWFIPKGARASHKETAYKGNVREVYTDGTCDIRWADGTTTTQPLDGTDSWVWDFEWK